MKNLKTSKKVFIAGHNGMVGSAIYYQLEKDPEIEIIKKSREELDLTNQSAVKEFLEKEKPKEVYLAAAKVGGIWLIVNILQILYPKTYLFNLM